MVEYSVPEAVKLLEDKRATLLNSLDSLDTDLSAPREQITVMEVSKCS